jgi:glucosamine-6-phosphate deaminase
MQLHVYDTPEQACRAAAYLFAAQITEKADSVLGLATGSTPIPCYQELISFYNAGTLDFSKVTTFNLDEYCGIDYKHPESYHAFMDRNLFDHVNIDHANVHVPGGNTDEDGAAYDEMIRARGGVDIQLLGIGGNGHIGFNEPADAFSYGTHVVELAQSTIEANSRFFDSIDEVPKKAITMGVGNIMSARKVVLIATGAAKAKAIYETVHGEITPKVPATILRTHPNCVILCDREAAALL